MKKILLSALIALPMTVMAAETYKIFSVNQSTNFFESGKSNNEAKILGKKGPGSNELVGGNTEAGFYGEVPASKLFTGPELADKVNLYEGIEHNDTAPWLKFAYKGKLLYIAKRSYRYKISYDDLYYAKIVKESQFNNPTVSLGEVDMAVTLMTCSNKAPSEWNDTGYYNEIEGEIDSTNDPAQSDDSEWNKLIYKVHQYKPVTQKGENWHNYDSYSLYGANYSDGSKTLCQERWKRDQSRVVFRGYSSIRHFLTADKGVDYRFAHNGWRPVLRVKNQ